MDNELAYQAFYDVRYRKSVLLCDFQSIYYTRPCNRVFGRCGITWCGSLYGNGFRVEQSDKRCPAYTVVQVATNDLIILVAFIPIVKFLLGVSNVTVPWDTLILSVILFVVIPLAGGMLTRYLVTKKKGKDYFENTFVKKFDGITTIGLLLTLIMIFSFQGNVILENPLHIVLIAVPLILQTFLIFAIAYAACKLLKLPHKIAAPAGMIGASNFFELAVAVAVALFGTTSPAALATTVGVLTEVPVMLFLVKVANSTKGWFKND